MRKLPIVRSTSQKASLQPLGEPSTFRGPPPRGHHRHIRAHGHMQGMQRLERARLMLRLIEGLQSPGDEGRLTAPVQGLWGASCPLMAEEALMADGGGVGA
jgi:hypothetical protein